MSPDTQAFSWADKFSPSVFADLDLTLAPSKQICPLLSRMLLFQCRMVSWFSARTLQGQADLADLHSLISAFAVRHDDLSMPSINRYPSYEGIVQDSRHIRCDCRIRFGPILRNSLYSAFDD